MEKLPTRYECWAEAVGNTVIPYVCFWPHDNTFHVSNLLHGNSLIPMVLERYGKTLESANVYIYNTDKEWSDIVESTRRMRKEALKIVNNKAEWELTP